MTYKGLDFDADKSLLYSEIRSTMAKIHVADGDYFLFGPVEASLMPDDVSEEDF